MRVRRTPSIQAHVTNRVDHPLLLAADAAAAVALGFRELETTVPVLRDAPSNALALLVGGQVAARRARSRSARSRSAPSSSSACAALTTYAETVSVYGTEQVFVDGDDTPWSKAFLAVLLRLARPQDALHLGLGRRVPDGRDRGQARCSTSRRAASR